MKKGRKKKVRFVESMPKISQFSPRGKPGRPDEVELRIDQFEALKLADYLGYKQDEAAVVMGISRPSFGRIVREARRCVADALVNGKIIRIRISDVQVGIHKKELVNKRIPWDSADQNVRNANIEKTLKDKIIDA